MGGRGRRQVRYGTWFRRRMQPFRATNGSLVAYLRRVAPEPPAMDSSAPERFMIANIGFNGWADNLKCAVDLFLLSVLDRFACVYLWADGSWDNGYRDSC